MERALKKLEYYRLLALENGDFNKYVQNTVLDNRKLAEYINNTVKIEGNTISYNDTLKFLTQAVGINELYNKYMKEEIFELEGMKAAILYSYSNIGKKLNEEFIINIHKLLYGPSAEIYKGIFPGMYRTYESFTYRPDGSKKQYLDYRLIYEEIG